MKKYNTPEIIVSIFDTEAVLTASEGLATFNQYVEDGAAYKQFSWSELNEQINWTF